MAAVSTFDPTAAADTASRQIDAVWSETQKRIDQEVDYAKGVADRYAQHLAEGGDPSIVPGQLGYRERVNNQPIVSELTGAIAVYREWNRARGSRNPLLPIQNLKAWKVVERLVETLGQPVPYAELAGESRFRLSSAEVQKAMREAEKESGGELVPRRTKLDGKVAFYLRERRPDDAPFDPENFYIGRDVKEEA